MTVENWSMCTFFAEREDSPYMEQGSARNSSVSDKEFITFCGIKKRSILGQARHLKEWQDLCLVPFPRHVEVVSAWNSPGLPRKVCFILCPSVLPVPLVVIGPQRTTVALWAANTQFWGAFYLTETNMFHRYFTVLFGYLCLCTYQLEKREESKNKILEGTRWKMFHT